MNEQNQDALRCADELATGENFYYESSMSYDYILSEASVNAAAHIRRLVAENDTLREDLRKFREAASCERDLRQEQERHATALLRQAVEALEKYDTPAQRLDGSPCREPIDKRLCAAIRQHLGQKGETQ